MGSRVQHLSDRGYYALLLPALAYAPARLRQALLPVAARRRVRRQPAASAEIERNLGRVFPEADVAWLRHRNALFKIQEDLEYFYYHRWNAENISGQFGIHGLEVLREARQQAKGALLVTAHLGPFCSAVVALGHRGIALNYIAHNSPDDPRCSPAYRSYARRKIAAMEQACHRPFQLFDLGEASTEASSHIGLHSYSRLQKNEFVAMAVDIPPFLSANTDEIEFLGLPCRFPNGFLKLAYLAECPVIPFFSLWDEKQFHRRRIVVEAPIPLQGSTRADLQTVVDRLTQVIENHPAQWFVWDSFSHFLV